MKHLNLIFVSFVVLFSTQSMAKGFLSRFELVNGSPSECPLLLDVQRKDQTIIIKTENSADMNGRGPFLNNLYFSNINKGWIESETNSVGTFSSKVELTLSSSLATLSKSSKLVSEQSILVHTEVSLTVDDQQQATLQYRGLTPKAGYPMPAYSNIECHYKQSL